MIHVAVTPKVSLADEPVKICVSGLAPNQLVTLRASMKDEKGVLFHSRAFYRANATGELDLEQAVASGGNYQGVLPMGLFWSLRPEKPYYRLIKRDVMGSPFRVTLDVYDSIQVASVPDVEPVASQTVERWFVIPGVQRIKISEGRVRGALFLPPGDGPFPGVIDMFGGVGGLVEFRAALFASHGFATLSLAYFAYEDLPPELTEVDLEYFEEAAELLLRHPKVLGPGVGVVAVSKGAEIALAMATFLEQVKATVCINGTNCMNGTPLHYRGLHMPCMPFVSEGMSLTDVGAMDCCHVFADPRASVYQDCVLPVEKAKGDMLFVIGGEDRSLNGKMYAEEVLERLKRHGRRNGHLLFYPSAGHLIEPPCSPFCRMSMLSKVSLPMMWGGELVPHTRAQEHSWPEILSFLQRHLRPGHAVVSKL